jgi:XTP/dITP diphosphohydrolase
VPPTPELARCVVASGNRGKLREIEYLLAGLGIRFATQAELGIRGADETGKTFAENALLKARHAVQASGLPAIADDSGLSVKALDGRPGVRSARYAGANATDQENIAKLLEELREIPPDQRRASFHCAAVLVMPDSGAAPIVALGEWSGRILEAPVGTSGFGYDPVFFDEQLGKSAAEMTTDEKNAVSHRGKALRQLASRLRREGAG